MKFAGVRCKKLTFASKDAKIASNHLLTKFLKLVPI